MVHSFSLVIGLSVIFLFSFAGSVYYYFLGRISLLVPGLWGLDSFFIVLVYSLSRIFLSRGMQLYNSSSINTFKLHGSLGSPSLGSWITGFYYSLVYYGRLMDIFRFSWFSWRRRLLSSAVRNLSSCRHQALQRNSIHRSYHHVRFSFHCLSTR